MRLVLGICNKHLSELLPTCITFKKIIYANILGVFKTTEPEKFFQILYILYKGYDGIYSLFSLIKNDPLMKYNKD